VTKVAVLAVGVITLAGLSACSSKLETGYEPTKLDMSVAQRKALYADPYSPEAQDAAEDNGDSDTGNGGVHNPHSY
jgi:hypothetical protein